MSLFLIFRFFSLCFLNQLNKKHCRETKASRSCWKIEVCSNVMYVGTPKFRPPTTSRCLT